MGEVLIPPDEEGFVGRLIRDGSPVYLLSGNGDQKPAMMAGEDTIKGQQPSEIYCQLYS